MNKLLPLLVSAMLILWLTLGSWWYTKNYTGNMSSPSFTVTLDGFEIEADETFYFFESSPDPIIPESTDEAFQTIADLLVNDKSILLKLYGLHSHRESTADLGKARAKSIQSELVSLGAPESQIAITGISMSSGQFVNGKLYGGVYFRFDTRNKKRTPTNENSSATSELLQTMIIPYDANQTDFDLTSKLKNYLKEAKGVLKRNPNTSITIVGHTNGDGNVQKEAELSKRRTKNVKMFLIRQGFDPKRLILDHKGNTVPKSKKNKNENRRVELVLTDF